MFKINVSWTWQKSQICRTRSSYNGMFSSYRKNDEFLESARTEQTRRNRSSRKIDRRRIPVLATLVSGRSTWSYWSVNQEENPMFPQDDAWILLATGRSIHIYALSSRSESPTPNCVQWRLVDDRLSPTCRMEWRRLVASWVYVRRIQSQETCQNFDGVATYLHNTQYRF